MATTYSNHNRIFIVGFMGSGKTTMGRQIANDRGMQFFDLDREIECYTNKTISEIFQEYGESYFRDIESSVLRKLSCNSNCVIAAGGGTPCHSNNMDFMLSKGYVIYLKATPQQFAEWLSVEQEKMSRPLLRNIPSDKFLVTITEMIAEREVYYNRSNEIVVL